MGLGRGLMALLLDVEEMLKVDVIQNEAFCK